MQRLGQTKATERTCGSCLFEYFWPTTGAQPLYCPGCGRKITSRMSLANVVEVEIPIIRPKDN